MNQIQIWQLLVDIGLITSVLIMTTRAFKSSRLPGMLPRTRELEASLRTLIQEAEQAGIHLNDQLLRREQNIQRSLLDIKESEARMGKALAEADALQHKLQVTRAETIRLIQDVKSGFERGLQTEIVRFAEDSRQRVEQAAPQQPKKEAAAASSQPRPDQRRPSQKAAPSSDDGYVRPQSRAESSATPPPPRGADLKRVYESAETMLKEGQAVETIASRMKLPVEKVKLLAEMIEIEREEDTRRRDSSHDWTSPDSRLGALASMKRQSTSF